MKLVFKENTFFINLVALKTFLALFYDDGYPYLGKFTQKYGANATKGELEPGVQDPGGEEQDDAGVLLPHSCGLHTEQLLVRT